jgi:hypothetical protein
MKFEQEEIIGYGETWQIHSGCWTHYLSLAKRAPAPFSPLTLAPIYLSE